MVGIVLSLPIPVTSHPILRELHLSTARWLIRAVQIYNSAGAGTRETLSNETLMSGIQRGANPCSVAALPNKKVLGRA